MFNCKNCKKDFLPNYRIGKKIIRFCSKSCATKYLRSRSKETIIENSIKTIQTQNRYLTGVELFKNLKISTKVFNKLGLSVTFLNKKAGFTKPKSVFQDNILKLLKEIFNDFKIIEEKSFNDCVSPKGFKLYFDFYIKELRLIIEADGDQHTNTSNPNFSSYTYECDRIKDKYCLKNNLEIVRIPYNRKIQLEYILRAFDTPSKKKLLEYSKNSKDETISSQDS